MHLDRLAQRYGVIPTALLGLGIDEWTLVCAVADAGCREDDRQANEMRRQAERARRR